ncbi:hypothetical protein PC129_g19372 [Phytophthora cactorum]|uniref:Uncharacterized protein n=1 Tax=Phytophthora cactorum TaxID=29920 RepID=A0A329RDW3_9STRA|nr:hypothetical protein Pcac1_g14342 [Phytophthora cactorum]KAG2821110.1 hypothetical protein PC112_g11508 [Phytophthora cactorum]KAG2823549.1 hypothetical protein PC111_g10175 [Phytophthora cactorum]KAG2830993.1 hypothetical protein PC113_g21011 [Phytophthora cactorum]KAG2878455.1 hypothetical protein PC114_g23109 [Phytophthora cactorum]
MNTVVASAALLPEAIQVVFVSLAGQKKRLEGLEDVRESLVEPPPAGDEGSDEASSEKQHYARKVPMLKREKRQTYYFVDWEST